MGKSTGDEVGEYEGVGDQAEFASAMRMLTRVPTDARITLNKGDEASPFLIMPILLNWVTFGTVGNEEVGVESSASGVAFARRATVSEFLGEIDPPLEKEALRVRMAAHGRGEWHLVAPRAQIALYLPRVHSHAQIVVYGGQTLSSDDPDDDVRDVAWAECEEKVISTLTEMGFNYCELARLRDEGQLFHLNERIWEEGRLVFAEPLDAVPGDEEEADLAEREAESTENGAKR